MDTKDKLLTNITVNPTTDCWEWNKGCFPAGYGQLAMKSNGKWSPQYTHRLSYELFKGPIGKGMQVCHSCDNRKCINPAHLFQGTIQDNIHDKVAKGRQTRGESHISSKLTEEVVRGLRDGTLKPSKELADKLGVCASHLYRIRLGRLWKHID